MADYCKGCGGTGMEVNGKYCTCVDGRLRRRTDDARKKAIEITKEAKQEAVRIAEGKSKEKNNDLLDKEINKLGFGIGDWVEHGDLIGIIEDIDGTKARFIGHHTKTHKPYDAAGWVPIKSIKPAKIESFENFNISDAMNKLNKMAFDRSIDYALETKNKELFESLMKGRGSDGK